MTLSRLENASSGVIVGNYRVDSGASRFTVRAFAGGMLSALGHNPTLAIRDFTGDIDFDPASPEDARLQMQVRADSLEVTGDIKARDRSEMESTMNREALKSSQYPVIRFESTGTSTEKIGEGWYRIALSGNLTLRGVTCNLPVTAQVIMAGDLLRASGEFSILQSDYGIRPVSVAGGTLKLKDELKFSFDIVSRKQA